MKKFISSNYLWGRIFSIFIIEVIITTIVAPCYASQIEKEQCKAAQTSLEQLQIVESKLAIERSRLQDQHPVIQDLNMQRQALTDQLQNQVKLCPSSLSKIHSPLSEPVMGLW
jgi:Tfp pilus assembly protein PilE